MSDSILNANNEKVVHKQGPNWDIAGRYEDFDSADKRRKKEIGEGKSAKVQHLATGFVVKTRATKVQVNDVVEPEVKKERTASKQKRQDRDSKR